MTDPQALPIVTGVPRLRDPSQRVSPRARLMWAASGMTTGLFLFAAEAVVTRVFAWVEPRWWVTALIAVVVAVEVLVVPPVRYAVHRWEVTETAVYTQTGWWSIERRIAPMSRIQTVDYGEGPVERLFRLASVTVTTASAAGALAISGLDRTQARELVEQLTHRADAVGGDAT